MRYSGRPANCAMCILYSVSLEVKDEATRTHAMHIDRKYNDNASMRPYCLRVECFTGPAG
jgi:hypothetical protein